VKYKDEEWLRETYADHSIQEMADIIDCSTATIHKYMEKYGIERPDKHAAKGGKHTDKEWLQEKYVGEKLSQKEIAELCDVQKTTIKYWLDRHDIDIRSKSEAAKIRAERYPHTHGTEYIRDYCWIHDASEEELQEFREGLSQARQGDDNPMYDRTGPDHPRWVEDKPPHRFYASKRWEQARQDALDRDDRRCQACGMTQEQHRETYEQGLHVHHIQPVSAGGPRFDVNNLVTLCHEHHHEYEGLPVKPELIRDE
jgi:transposase